MAYEKLLTELENGSSHLIIDGPAGSGKTTLINHFLDNTNRKVVVAAPTGIAASHLQGVSIHSLFGFPPSAVLPWEAKVPFHFPSRLDTLILDELSMISGNTLDGIDRVLRMAKNQMEIPFGGVRIVLVGDHFQLGPVVTDMDRPYLEEYSKKYKPPFFYFNSDIWKNEEFTNNIRFYRLTKNFRQQKDKLFQSILNNARIGELKDHDVEILNLRIANIFDKQRPIVALTNKTVNAHNLLNLLCLPGESSTLSPVLEEVKFPGDRAIAEHIAYEPVTVKPGARIMTIKNCYKRDNVYYNGSLGMINCIRKNKSGEIASVLVTLDTGKIVEVVIETFPVMRPLYNKESDRVESTFIAGIRMLPLKLGYGFTAHKAQGSTLDEMVIYKDMNVFSPGQMYSIISRVRSLDNLALTSELSVEDFEADPEVVSHYFNMLHYSRAA